MSLRIINLQNKLIDYQLNIITTNDSWYCRSQRKKKKKEQLKKSCKAQRGMGQRRLMNRKVGSLGYRKIMVDSGCTRLKIVSEMEKRFYKVTIKGRAKPLDKMKLKSLLLFLTAEFQGHHSSKE